MHAAFERFGAHGDRRQRIVDLVGHAGGQKADAGQLLAADDLLGALLHLAIEIVANGLKARGHVVHGVGQLRHLVVRAQSDAIAEFAGRHAPRTFDQHPQRTKDPGIEQPDENDQQQQRRDRGEPGQHDPGVILRMDFALELFHALIEMVGQLGGQRLQPLELDVERLSLAIVVDPGFAGGRSVNRRQALVDLADGELFFFAVIDAMTARAVVVELGAIVFQRLMDGGSAVRNSWPMADLSKGWRIGFEAGRLRAAPRTSPIVIRSVATCWLRAEASGSSAARLSRLRTRLR